MVDDYSGVTWTSADPHEPHPKANERRARRGAVDGNGALLEKNIRLEETVQVPSSPSGVVRWRSPEALRHGTWFVQVTALEIDGVTGCPPDERNCNERWSNVRRVTVPKPS